MFKKPFKVKSNSQLKGSDRKKLRTDMINQFPSLTEETLNSILPNKETSFLLKVLTHSGEVVHVYCVQKLPIVFEIRTVMYPTVYMLWHAPDLLPSFTTHRPVFPIIMGGADLMLPGVVLPGAEGIHAYGRLNKGDRCSINLVDNKAPIAVGKTANSSYDMYMCAKRGKCVEVLHFYGDQLSTFGTKLVAPELGPAFETEKETIADDEVLSDIPSEENKADLIQEELASCTERLMIDSVNGNEISEAAVPDGDPDVDDSDQENVQDPIAAMDELLQYCFLKSLRTTMKKAELPLLTSTYFKLHMIPACPKGNTLDIKKSSYKKLSNFLDEMVKKNVIVVESPQKGVQSISKIDFSNELVTQFVDNFTNDEHVTGLLVDTSKTNKSSVPEITEKYTVTAAVLPLFYAYDYKKKEAVTAEVVRKVVTDYVRVKNLQNPLNKKEVALDQVLRSATNAPSDVEFTPYDQLISRVFAQMGHSFKVEFGSGETPLIKGKLPPIDIQVGTRSGNKKVTLVNNLELYGINLTEFSRECQHGVAASTTINTVPSAKSAQLQVQGNQVTFVAKILTEKYQIPKRYLRGLENAPKKRK